MQDIGSELLRRYGGGGAATAEPEPAPADGPPAPGPMYTNTPPAPKITKPLGMQTEPPPEDVGQQLYAKFHVPTAGEWVSTLTRNLLVNPSIQTGEAAVTANAVASHAIASVIRGTGVEHPSKMDWKGLWSDFTDSVKDSGYAPTGALLKFVGKQHEKGSSSLPPISEGIGMKGVEETKQLYNQQMPEDAAVQQTTTGKLTQQLGGVVGMGEQAAILGATGLGAPAAWGIAMADTGAAAQFADAKAHGATDEQASIKWAEALGVNAAMAPALGAWFAAAEKLGGPPLAKLIAGGLSGSGGMVAMNAATNALAQSYDPKRGILEGSIDAAKFGGLFGLVATAVHMHGENAAKGEAGAEPTGREVPTEPAPENRGQFEARAAQTYPDVSPERANYRLAKQEGAPTDTYERSMSLDDAVAERMAERPDLSTNDATLEVVNENKAKAEAMLAREEEDRRQSEERRKIATGELPPEGERRTEDRRLDEPAARPLDAAPEVPGETVAGAAAPVQAPPFEAPGGSKGEEPFRAPESDSEVGRETDRILREDGISEEELARIKSGAPEQPPTSLKEATVTEERAAIGLDPIEKVASRGYEDVVWPEATKKMQEDPGLGQRLAAEIAAKPRPLTDTEVAVLLRNKVAAHNEAGRIEAELLKAQESGDAHAVEALELQARNVSDRNVAADESIANSKRATAQGLAALRMMANEDNSLAALETKARIKAGGRPLTTDERAELRDISEKLIAAEKKIADYEAKASTPAPTKARVLSFIEAQAQAARERIKARGTRAMAGIDPVDFADRVIVGVEYLAKDIKKFADWSTAMVKEFGETIKPHLQAIFDAAKAKLAESPKEAGRLQAFKTRTAKAIKTTEEATAAGNFGPKPKPKPLALDAEAIKLKTDYEEVKRRRDVAFARYSLENRNTGQKAADVAKESVNATKQIITSADLSAVLRQGAVFSLDPTNWKKLATDWGPKMLQATFSERKAMETDVALRNRPGAAELEKAGLELTRLDGPLNKHEEHMRSNLVEKIPFIGPMVRGSNRAFVTFLNLQRAAAADRFVEAIPGEHTPERLKRLAAAVNTMTGRGEVSGSFKGAVSAASDVLWSPRLLLSRFQLLSGQPMWRGDATTRTIIAKQYARTLGGVATVYALARLAGGEVEDDPRSSDFGKIRFGNTRIDPLAGISQVSVLLARTATGETKTASGEVHPLRKPIFGEGEGPKYGQADMADIYGRFARSKLSPTLGVPLDLLSGEDVTGQPVTPADLPQKMLVPLAFQDILKAMGEQGIPAGVAMSILSMLGMGLQTYEAKQPSAKPARRFGPRLPSLR